VTQEQVSFEGFERSKVTTTTAWMVADMSTSSFVTGSKTLPASVVLLTSIFFVIGISPVVGAERAGRLVRNKTSAFHGRFLPRDAIASRPSALTEATSAT
jgi:hypothetical protein